MNKPVQYITFVEDKFSADEIENLGSFFGNKWPGGHRDVHEIMTATAARI